MLILERIAREVFRVPGVAQVQSITRPLGTPIDHSSIPFQISLQNTGQVMNLTYQRQRADDMLKQADELTKSIDVLKHQYTLQQELAATTHDQAESFQEMTATLSEIRDNMANLDDFLRPIRNYFYWEPHCYNLPSCSAARSAFEALDGVDRMSGQLKSVGEALEKLNAIQPQLVELMPGQITSQETNRELLLSSYSTMSGIYDQMAAMTGNSMAMGQAFDAARIDDFFYLPPEAFDNPDFQRGLTMFLSPDGHAARMIITHDGDPATPAGIARIDPIKNAANVAVKAPPCKAPRSRSPAPLPRTKTSRTAPNTT